MTASKPPDEGAPRTKRECLDAVIADLNLDVRDPFTHLLANALALFDQQQEERMATLRHIEARSNLTQQILALEDSLIAERQRCERLEGKLCLVCGAKEPCELDKGEMSPCTFDPSPIEAAKRFLLRASQAESRAASAVAPCEWNEDCEGCWTTGCGEMFYFNDGTPEQNNARFCHGCGHPVSATKYVDPPIEDDAASGEAG